MIEEILRAKGIIGKKLKINGTTKAEYPIKSGETLTTGDLVNILNVANDVFTIEASQPFGDLGDLTFKALALSKEKILLYYRKGATTNLTAKIVVLKNGKITIGSEYVLRTNCGSSFDAGIVSDNVVIFTYRDTSNLIQAYLLNIEDTTITLGSGFNVFPNSSNYVSILVLNPSVAIVYFQNTSNEFNYAYNVSIRGGSLALHDVANPVTVSQYSNRSVETTMLTQVTGFIVFQNQSTGSLGYIALFELDRDGVRTLSGIAYSFTTIAVSEYNLTRLNDTQVLLTYITQNEARARVVTKSGNVPSLGTEIVLSTISGRQRVIKLSDTRLMVMHSDNDGNGIYTTKLSILNISGTTITIESTEVIDNNYLSWFQFVEVDEDKLFFYMEGDDYSVGYTKRLKGEKEVEKSTSYETDGLVYGVNGNIAKIYKWGVI